MQMVGSWAEKVKGVRAWERQLRVRLVLKQSEVEDPMEQGNGRDVRNTLTCLREDDAWEQSTKSFHGFV